MISPMGWGCKVPDSGSRAGNFSVRSNWRSMLGHCMHACLTRMLALENAIGRLEVKIRIS